MGPVLVITVLLNRGDRPDRLLLRRARGAPPPSLAPAAPQFVRERPQCGWSYGTGWHGWAWDQLPSLLAGITGSGYPGGGEPLHHPAPPGPTPVGRFVRDFSSRLHRRLTGAD